MTSPTIYSGSERILKAGVFCTLLDLTLTSDLSDHPPGVYKIIIDSAISNVKRQKNTPGTIPGVLMWILKLPGCPRCSVCRHSADAAFTKWITPFAWPVELVGYFLVVALRKAVICADSFYYFVVAPYYNTTEMFIVMIYFNI